MLKIVTSNKFLKDLKLAKKRGLDLAALNEVVNKLANKEKSRRKVQRSCIERRISRFP